MLLHQAGGTSPPQDKSEQLLPRRKAIKPSPWSSLGEKRTSSPREKSEPSSLPTRAVAGTGPQGPRAPGPPAIQNPAWAGWASGAGEDLLLQPWAEAAALSWGGLSWGGLVPFARSCRAAVSAVAMMIARHHRCCWWCLLPRLFVRPNGDKMIVIITGNRYNYQCSCGRIVINNHCNYHYSWREKCQ